MISDIVSYYKDRANEYETVYDKPERQADLLLARKILQDTFAGKEIFEIACGTGYWTEILSRTAASIVATDINEAVIELARKKTYSPATVEFEIADIFKWTSTVKYESLFGGFIWSHIRLEDLNNFIDIVNSIVHNGGTIVFIDNNYIEGSSLPLVETDAFGNTYQIRNLQNGATYKVLKNFPSYNFLIQLLAGKATDIDFINLQYYWILKYRTV